MSIKWNNAVPGVLSLLDPERTCGFLYYTAWGGPSGISTQVSQLCVHMLSCCAVLNHFIHVRLLVTLWTVAHQVPLSRQEYWSGLPYPPPGDLPNLGIKPTTSTSPALASVFFTTRATWEAPVILLHLLNFWQEVEHILYLILAIFSIKSQSSGFFFFF